MFGTREPNENGQPQQERVAPSRWSRCSRKVRPVGGHGKRYDVVEMIGEAGSKATNRYALGGTIPPHSPQHALVGWISCRRRSPPHVSTSSRWPRREAFGGYITRASVPNEVVARLGLPEGDNGGEQQRDARENWRCHLESDSPTRRRLGRILQTDARS